MNTLPETTYEPYHLGPSGDVDDAWAWFGPDSVAHTDRSAREATMTWDEYVDYTRRRVLVSSPGDSPAKPGTPAARVEELLTDTAAPARWRERVQPELVRYVARRRLATLPAAVYARLSRGVVVQSRPDDRRVYRSRDAAVWDLEAVLKTVDADIWAGRIKTFPKMDGLIAALDAPPPPTPGDDP